MGQKAPRDTGEGGDTQQCHTGILALVQAQTATTRGAAQRGATTPACGNSQLPGEGKD